MKIRCFPKLGFLSRKGVAGGGGGGLTTTKILTNMTLSI